MLLSGGQKAHSQLILSLKESRNTERGITLQEQVQRTPTGQMLPDQIFILLNHSTFITNSRIYRSIQKEIQCIANAFTNSLSELIHILIIPHKLPQSGKDR